MDITILDDRDGFNKRTRIVKSLDELSNTWNEVKTFISPMADATIVIILESYNGTGKLNISGGGHGAHSYDLMVLHGKVRVIK